MLLAVLTPALFHLVLAPSEPPMCSILLRTLSQLRIDRPVQAQYGMLVGVPKPICQVLFEGSLTDEAVSSVVDRTHQCSHLISLTKILWNKTTASWKADWLSP